MNRREVPTPVVPYFLALTFLISAIGWLVYIALKPEPEPDEPNLNSFLTVPTIDKCYEYQYIHEKACPEGYGPVVVNTPSSDTKTWCKESFGAMIDCGRVVE